MQRLLSILDTLFDLAIVFFGFWLVFAYSQPGEVGKLDPIDYMHSQIDQQYIDDHQ